MLPALLLAVWLVLQYAVALHVRHGAQVAAQDAALAGARGSGDPAAVAGSLMASLGASARRVEVRVVAGDERVTVTVEAEVIQIVPFRTFHVRESASAPIERFIPEDERP